MLIARHGEIYTKSEFVRKQFIKRLVDNLRLALPGIKVEAKRWRVLIYDDSHETIGKVKHVFGVVSFSKAIETKPELKEIKKVVEGLLPLNAESFAIDTQRLDKNFPLISQEVNEKIGELVLEKQPELKVNLKNPDVRIGVEIGRDSAFVFTENFKGVGGLPLGSAGGRISCDYENNLDVLAAWMMMKRGVIVTPLHEKLKSWSYGYTQGKTLNAKVVGITSVEEFVEKQKQAKEVLFAPLIGLNEKEINELKELVLS